MNEVEKMYKLAQIANEGYDAWDMKDIYPPFTAEKQLELVKWLGKNKNGFGYFNDGATGLSCHCDFNWEWFDKDFYAEDFDNALAGLINSLWQDLTEEARKQVREILE